VDEAGIENVLTANPRNIAERYQKRIEELQSA
jgi:hypothetical protein